MILGGGTGSTIAAWTFAEEGQRVVVIDRKYIRGSRQILHAGEARTSSIVRRSHPIFAKASSSASPATSSRSTCWVSVTASARLVSGLNEMYLGSVQLALARQDEKEHDGRRNRRLSLRDAQ